jgi:hypothetical protein
MLLSKVLIPPLACLALLVPAAVSAGIADPAAPRIFLHLTHPTTKGILCDRGAIDDCTQAVVNGDLYPNGLAYFLYVEVSRGALPSIAGIQLGVSYDPVTLSGVDVFGWTYCLDAHFASDGPHGAWPAPGSGNLMTWFADANCQTGPTTVAGYFYLAAYSPDVFRVLPRPVDGRAAVATCEAEVSVVPPSNLGRVAFSSGAVTPGCNPCVDDCTTTTPQGNPIQPLEVPTVAVTWSSVKSLFGVEGR